MRIKFKLSKRVVWAFVLATFAIVLSYYSTNSNISLTGEKSVLTYWNAFTEWATSGSERPVPDDVVFINIEHDKQLVEITDDFGFPVGNSPITDREKLARLLALIEKSETYQYVLLDVFLGDGYKSASDSALFRRISRMDRIVIPKHTDGSLVSDELNTKAGYADYITSLNENDFTKYSLFIKEGSSLPLKIYTETTGKTVKRTCLWYSDDCSLARKVIFPKMTTRLNGPYTSTGEKSILNLGSDILDNEAELDWAEFFKGKFIVIGSLDGDDVHSTYAGEQPGCLILYNVYKSLLKGQHKIPFVLILFYFAIFFAMAYLLLKGDNNGSASWAWVWAKLFVFYSLILTIVCIFVFAIWGQAHDIFITSSFFSVVNVICRRLKTKNENHA